MRSCAASSIGCRWSPTSRRSAFRSSARRLTRFAKFCGYARLDGFARDLTHHLTQVEKHYARLFEDAPTLSAASGSLVFTGVADDPETLATLRRARLSAPGSRGRDRSRLALRPARRGAQRPRARGADGIDAGAARSLRRIGRRGRRALRLRRSAGAHAGLRRAPVDPALERRFARIVRRCARQRAAAGAR